LVKSTLKESENNIEPFILIKNILESVSKAVFLLIFVIGACFFCGCVNQSQPIIPPNDNLTDAKKKLSTDLLQLTGIIKLPERMTRDDLEQLMEKDHQLIWVDENGNETDEKSKSHKLVYIYIKTRDNTDLNVLKTIVWNITDTDSANNLVVAWVDTDNLVSLASLDSVQSIQTVTPPMTR
jgi:hypothetical protein